MTRLDPDHLTDLPATVAARVASLSAMRTDGRPAQVPPTAI